MVANFLRLFVLSATAVWSMFACSMPASAEQPPELPTKSVLKWNRSDHLAGQIVEATPQGLTWNSNLFEEPLQLRIEAVRSIAWQYAQPTKLPNRGVRVETTLGNFLVGDLLSVDGDVVLLESSDFGRLAIPRRSVRSFVNLASSSGRWLGPMRAEDWDADRESKMSIDGNAQGQVVIPAASMIFKKFAITEKTLIDVGFRWSGTLDMKFGFAVPTKWGKLDSPDKSQESGMVVVKMDPEVLEQIPRLEMFSDSMVLQQKELFDIILEEVDLSAGFLHLVFELDPQANEVKAYDAAGKLLATVNISPLTDDFESGFVVLNQYGRLALDHLIVATIPGDFNPLQEVIATKQGTLTGTVESFDGETWSIRRASDNALVQVAKDDFYMDHIACVAEEFTAHEIAGRDDSTLTRVELRDGSRVAGSFENITDNHLRLVADVGPMAIRLDQAQRLDFPKASAQQNEASTHLLETEDGQCRGWLSSKEGQSSDLQWRVVGSDKPVTLLAGDFRIQSTSSAADVARKSLELAPPRNPNGYRDQLYLRNGDCFPANVLRFQSGELQTEAFQRMVSFPVSDVVRCVLAVPVESPSTLDNPPWRIMTIEEKPSEQLQGVNDGKVTRPYACHPSLMETGSFTLTIPGKAKGADVDRDAQDNQAALNMGNGAAAILEIKPFVSQPSDPGISLYLSVNSMRGDQRIVSLGLDPALSDYNPIELESADDIVCNIRYKDSELIGTINGIERCRKRVILPPDASRGVAIALNDKLPITSIRQESSYALRTAFIRNESREVALTEPRFVRHQPARSLLIGRNSDLWRADIVSMNEDSVTVRSGGRHLVIDRSLVSSLVWPTLPPVEVTPPESMPDETGETVVGATAQHEASTGQVAESKAIEPSVALAPTAPEKLTDIQLMISDGTKLTLRPANWDSEKVVGTSDRYGRIELATADVIELRCGGQITSASDHEGQQWQFKLGKNLPPNSGSEGPKGDESPLVGQDAPTFTVKGLDGSNIDLATYRGKVVVLDFWATWCGYCVAELPSMIAEIDKLPADKVQLITLNQNEESATVAEWMTSKGLQFLVGLDKDQVAPQYEVNGLPTTIVIDPTGKIVHVKVGGGEEPFEEMMQVVRKLVEEGSDSAMASTTSTHPAQKPSTFAAATPESQPGQTVDKSVAMKPAPEKLTPDKQGSQKNALVSVEAYIQSARDNQSALLVVRAKIADDHKIFSITQKAGGPVKTKIKLEPAETYRLGEFRALQKPKKYPEPSFNNMEVEVHQGVATWYATLEPVAGEALETLEIKGKVNMQLCNQNNCFAPRDYPFVAKVAKSLTDQDSIDLSKIEAEE